MFFLAETKRGRKFSCKIVTRFGYIVTTREQSGVTPPKLVQSEKCFGKMGRSVRWPVISFKENKVNSVNSG